MDNTKHKTSEVAVACEIATFDDVLLTNQNAPSKSRVMARSRVGVVTARPTFRTVRTLQPLLLERGVEALPTPASQYSSILENFLIVVCFPQLDTTSSKTLFHLR